MNNPNPISTVITTINSPTKAIKKFDMMRSSKLLVIGDKKTPKNFSIKRGDYLSYKDQLKLPHTFIKYCPLNHYSRKNIGYLHLFRAKPSIIAESDDDNIPYKFWGEDINFRGKYKFIECNDAYLNIYSLYSNQHIWPRGFPINKINLKNKIKIKNKNSNIGVWQGLADYNPDVDAIYRLTINNKIIFKKNDKYVLNKNLYCPFNSQNTFWSPEAYIFMYLPCTVAFRFTDILRSYICQKLLWNKNLHLGFCEATVKQERNQHDIFEDFNDEISMYKQVPKVVEILNNTDCTELSDSDALLLVYKNLLKENIIMPQEIKYVQSWINDYKSIFS